MKCTKNYMNKVRDYYEVAVAYLSLPVSYRFNIGVYFEIVRDEHLVFSDRHSMDHLIFEEVGKRGLFPQFKKMVNSVKESESKYGAH